MEKEEKIGAKEKHKLKQFIKQLAQHKGRHTELVTVYVPAGYDLNIIVGHLQQEQGTAANIKSKSTRDNVIGALERMVRHLQLIQRTPPNGLAAFSGDISEREGQPNIQVYSIQPPLPLRLRLYRCDKEFVLEPLMDMTEEKAVYGMVVLDRRDATLALLKGKTIIPLLTTHSEVPGKTRAGGQSSVRFARLREGAAIDHFKKIASYMKEQFLFLKELKGILLGGPSVTINDFIQKDYITGDVKKKIIGIKDLSYTGDFGLQELLEKSSDVLASEEVVEEKNIMQRFFLMLAKEPGKVNYGQDAVMKDLKLGAVDILLLSEELSDEALEEFEKVAEQYGTDVKIISTETREGVQLREMGKFAAILRYEVHRG
ncbi:MAG TPA: peptide chain release factor aRF-1 [Candidatus Nanoarchaeia archaeon]|nr:peptide chain release factor aRF-1 [Candidatus Nanoarchaeia archaeon]